jgi:tetratricopeptide (TPR) repeat protein
VWWEFLGKKFAGESGPALLKRLDTLLQGKVAPTDLEAWIPEIEPKQGQAPSQREARLWAVAEAWLAAGQERQAREALERSATASSTVEARLRLADFLAQRKDWTAAADWYGRAWEKDRKEPLALYLKGWALTQAGQTKEGQQLMDLSHWLPLGDEARRFNFADALSERSQADAARRERDLLMHVHSLGSVYAGDILRRQAYEALAKKDYLRAADSHERAMLRVLHPYLGFIQTAAYVGVPEHVHRYRARGLLDAGKLEEAGKEIDTAVAVLPGNIELAILLVPVLEKTKHVKEADELFEKVFAPWEKVCKDYPQSAFAHNSLAWVAACCHRRLEEGLKHARRAVELAPDNAGYIDTLAEVYFQRGDQKQAVELSKKCVALDPRREYFRKQVERHEAGDRAAELPDEGDND